MKKVHNQAPKIVNTTKVNSENAAREAMVNAYIESIMAKILQKKKETDEWKSQPPLFICIKEDVLKILSANKNRVRKSKSDQRNLFEYMKHKSKLASSCNSNQDQIESQSVKVAKENPRTETDLVNRKN
jgi:hypothetical protein